MLQWFFKYEHEYQRYNLFIRISEFTVQILIYNSEISSLNNLNHLKSQQVQYIIQDDRYKKKASDNLIVDFCVFDKQFIKLKLLVIILISIVK